MNPGVMRRLWRAEQQPAASRLTPASVGDKVASVSFGDRVDRLDESLVAQISTGGTSAADRRSLLALHAAIATRGDFAYLEVGSYHGASLQSFITDPRCRRIVSIDRRDEAPPDTRAEAPQYP